MLSRRSLIAAGLVAGITPAAAQITPPRGSAMRTEVLNALRPRVEAEVGGQIEFLVLKLRIIEPWAYVQVMLQRPGGGNIDWARTKFREEMREGYMSDNTMALLHRSAARWRVVELAIGPSDVAWDGWISSHKVPRKVFTDE